MMYYEQRQMARAIYSNIAAEMRAVERRGLSETQESCRWRYWKKTYARVERPRQNVYRTFTPRHRSRPRRYTITRATMPLCVMRARYILLSLYLLLLFLSPCCLCRVVFPSDITLIYLCLLMRAIIYKEKIFLFICLWKRHISHYMLSQSIYTTLVLMEKRATNMLDIIIYYCSWHISPYTRKF